MPENEMKDEAAAAPEAPAAPEAQTPEQPKPVDPTVQYMKSALGSFVEAVYATQSRMGMWNGVTSQSDYTKFFAELYSTLAKAYDTYAATGTGMDVKWFNPMTDDEVPVGDGVAVGLPAQLSEIALAMFGFMRHLGVDLGSLLVNMLKGQATMMAAPDNVPGIEDALDEIDGEDGPDGPGGDLGDDAEGDEGVSSI